MQETSRRNMPTMTYYGTAGQAYQRIRIHQRLSIKGKKFTIRSAHPNMADELDVTRLSPEDEGFD